jgi:hypothetical protein
MFYPETEIYGLYPPRSIFPREKTQSYIYYFDTVK